MGIVNSTPRGIIRIKWDAIESWNQISLPPFHSHFPPDSSPGAHLSEVLMGNCRNGQILGSVPRERVDFQRDGLLSSFQEELQIIFYLSQKRIQTQLHQSITVELGVAKRIRYLTPYYKVLAAISAVGKGGIKVGFKGSCSHSD